MIFVRILILVLIIVNLSGCAPFKSLPEKVEDSDKILGSYQNKCDTADTQSRPSLWDHIDSKNSIDKNDLTVKFGLTEKGMLKSQLLYNDSLLEEKIIKGKFKDDSCYYSRRKFYIIPLLPVLFSYSNKRQRIFRVGDSLVFEETLSEGGAVVIMASGHSWNYRWHYKSK